MAKTFKEIEDAAHRRLDELMDALGKDLEEKIDEAHPERMRPQQTMIVGEERERYGKTFRNALSDLVRRFNLDRSD